MRKVIVEVSDELVDNYFEGLDEVKQSDAETAVLELIDEGLLYTNSRHRGDDDHRRIVAGNDSGAGSSGLESDEGGRRLE